MRADAWLLGKVLCQRDGVKQYGNTDDGMHVRYGTGGQEWPLSGDGLKRKGVRTAVDQLGAAI